jgi:hypothetical protein
MKVSIKTLLKRCLLVRYHSTIASGSSFTSLLYIAFCGFSSSNVLATSFHHPQVIIRQPK